MGSASRYGETEAQTAEESDDDKLGLTIKGSSEEFKVAHAKIALLFGRKGEEIKMENINLKIVDVTIKIRYVRY